MRRVLVLATVLTAVGLAGCSAGSGPVFDNENSAPSIGCMRHQSAEPGTRYTDVNTRDSAEVLNVMRYYTANGAKPYCDGKAATEPDKRWAELYVNMGGTTAKVPSVLAGGS